MSYYLTPAWYMAEVARTLNPDLAPRDALTMAALGLAGEAGETSEIVKKHIFHSHPLPTDDLASELGDVLWYVAALASLSGFTLEDLMERNVTKLRKRFPHGFSPADSLARRDVEP